MAGPIFTTALDVTIVELDAALLRCYGDFEARIARFAREQGIEWESYPEDAADPEHFADTCRVQGVDLAHTVLMREGAQSPIVGVALLGRRGGRGWLGDFAIAPEHRGRGLGHRLMAAFLDQCRALGLREVEFDVLAVNASALRVYEAAGFRRDQRLTHFVAAARDLALTPAASGESDVAPLTLERLPAWYTEAMAHQPRPCWERDLPALLNDGNLHLLAFRASGGETAALAYRFRPSHRDPAQESIVIAFAGWRGPATASSLRALLAAAARAAGGATEVSAGLEPVGSALAGALRELGFRETRPAFNMRREL